MVKSLWAQVQESPRFMRSANGWLTVGWTAAIPVVLLLGWDRALRFVSFLSLYTVVTGHLSAWQAARVEVKQDEQAAGEEGDEGS